MISMGLVVYFELKRVNSKVLKDIKTITSDTKKPILLVCKG